MKNLRTTDIHVKAFVTSLIVTWLRHLISNSDNDNWSELSNRDFGKIFSLGDYHSKHILRNLQNPFWKDIFRKLDKI